MGMDMAYPSSPTPSDLSHTYTYTYTHTHAHAHTKVFQEVMGAGSWEYQE